MSSWEPELDSTHNKATRAGETVTRETIETHEAVNARYVSSGMDYVFGLAR